MTTTTMIEAKEMEDVSILSFIVTAMSLPLSFATFRLKISFLRCVVVVGVVDFCSLTWLILRWQDCYSFLSRLEILI